MDRGLPDPPLSNRNPLYGPQREKTCLWGFRTTKVQTSLHIRVVSSANLLFAYWKVSYLNLGFLSEISRSYLVSVAVQVGLSITLSENPKTSIVTSTVYLSRHIS